MDQKSVSASPKININDIKSGAIVHFKSGSIGLVTDNKRGLVRQVRVGIDIGDTYAFDWSYVYIDSVRYDCTLTPAQQNENCSVYRNTDSSSTLRHYSPCIRTK